MTLDELEAEAVQIRHELAEYLSMANQAHLSLVIFGKRLGRLEERIDALRADACMDRCEGSTSDGPRITPVRD